MRRKLTVFARDWLVVAVASSSARCANGSIFSEPPMPLYAKFEFIAPAPPELEAPNNSRGFFKIEYWK